MLPGSLLGSLLALREVVEERAASLRTASAPALLGRPIGSNYSVVITEV